MACLQAFLQPASLQSACHAVPITAKYHPSSRSQSTAHAFAAVCALIVASSVIAAAPEGEDADVERVALALRMAFIASLLTLATNIIPMAVVVYNCFVTPLVQHVWGADENCREVLCQVLMTALMLPYTITTTFFGCNSNSLIDLVSQLEGVMVGTVGANVSQMIDDDDDEDDERVGDDDADDETDESSAVGQRTGWLLQSRFQRTVASVKLKRLKREAFLLRMRSRQSRAGYAQN